MYQCLRVTGSFGMLGDIIIAEPNAYIVFAPKRVIEQTLNKTVPDVMVHKHICIYGWNKRLFNSIVPRNALE